MEPELCAEILDAVKAALSGFNPLVHHGQVIVHIGESDWELEVSYRNKRKSKTVVTPPPSWKK